MKKVISYRSNARTAALAFWNMMAAHFGAATASPIQAQQTKNSKLARSGIGTGKHTIRNGQSRSEIVGRDRQKFGGVALSSCHREK
jgi:hypothetical protein